MSDTPRTDAEAFTIDEGQVLMSKIYSPEGQTVYSSFARQLERELAEANATINLMHDANMRGIKAWQQAHPESDDTWPDQAKLVTWMMDELVESRKCKARFDLLLLDLRKLVKQLDCAAYRYASRILKSAIDAAMQEDSK